MHRLMLACMLLFSPLAFGALGQDISSVPSDAARMKASVNLLPGAVYSTHEMRLSTGTTVREFASPAGQVFGVSWQGPSVPDLRQLLGSYFEQYLQAAESSPRQHRVVHIETGDLVFESGGHMGFIVGRAYLRSKLPDGATADAVH
jgi:hypothetical protein